MRKSRFTETQIVSILEVRLAVASAREAAHHSPVGQDTSR